MKISTYHKKLGDKVKFVKGYHKEVPSEYWDRIYITTLFTYHWKITVEDIFFYKSLLHDDSLRIFIGGIMASLMPTELYHETGIWPIIGLLSTPGIFGDDNSYIIEEMIPDYNLFDLSIYKYSLLDSYFGYSTRGCVNKCDFCGVPILEPNFIEYKGIKPYIKEIDNLFGVKQNLVLFDNNILASQHFAEIIYDIIDVGFGKGAKLNDKLRYVDFNQGTDARLMKEWHFKLLSKIAISPLRIAFDHINLQKIYVNKIRLAAKYGITNLSNYILYNHNDTPEDLWKRLKININLNKELGVKIYSFPMKYIPLNAKDRKFIAMPKWNWYFLRGVQRILNVTGGSVMTGEDFFYRAFGESVEDFIKILYMPESILMYRGKTPGNKELEWTNYFDRLTESERRELLLIICKNRSKHTLINAILTNNNLKLTNILEYYLPISYDNNLPLFINNSQQEDDTNGS
jgi:hypothetical protein